ncbi:MAG: glycosyltransferase family 4 protein [Lachnospiraceae bacterium]|nr:glycosyltransferase family 4 protein [Lachnospiraceae bacterium]
MKKIGFVCPWFGWNIPGGAEAELRGLVTHLAESGLTCEVLTTCVREFHADWGKAAYRPGTVTERGIVIRRFVPDTRDREAFRNAFTKILAGELPLTDQEEAAYLAGSVNSKALYDYMDTHRQEYALYVFLPYLFGTTANGVAVAPEKSVVIPCLHEENYIRLRYFGERFSKVRGMAFLADAERAVAESAFDLSKVEKAVLGAGVDTEFTADGARFREKYGIGEHFLLYAGRKSRGKNVYTLLYCFERYLAEHPDSDLKLVLIGGGEIILPDSLDGRVLELGFVDAQDKYDAYAAADLLVQPSRMESFSIVIMESWLCGRPVLVHGDCAVTKEFAVRSGGGLYFEDYFEFAAAVEYLTTHPAESAAMGESGRAFVLEHFSWDAIVRKYTEFFQRLAGE